ncbi:site-specific integrase [Knoellia locipacati]|uniref:hypothetical protein n=1 Tax=Knoellia locipacati TaxID=882824 RepID=UPI00384AF4CB
MESLTRSMRMRLVADHRLAAKLGLPTEDGWLVPLTVFPGTKRPGLAPNTWTKILKNADKRVRYLCTKSGKAMPVRITPHTLRHTFAVEHLRACLAAMKEVLDVEPTDVRRLRRYLMNPLIEVRQMLGHSSITTTLVYLTEVAEDDPLAQLAYSSWTDAFLDAKVSA